MKVIKKQSLPLKTPQSLIHVKHNMTLTQYKYWVLFLHDVKQQILDGVEPDSRGYYYISMDFVNKAMGLKASQRKSIIFDDLKKLKDITVSYNVLEKDGTKAKIGHGFISEWSVSNSRIGYVLPRIFIEAMLEIDTNAKSIFQLLNWDIFNSFNGKYEAILYKLCKDYVGIGKTPYMTIDEYRAYIGLSSSEYPEMRDLNKRCIASPIKAINESIVSDIFVSVEFERSGRKTVGMRFLVENKRQIKLPMMEEQEHPAFKFSKIIIPVEQQALYLEKYQSEEVEVIIERANEYSDELKKQRKKVNIGAIYKKAFSEKWGVEKLAEKIEQQKQLKQKKKEQEDKERLEEKEKEKIRHQQQETEKAILLFENLPKNEQNTILDEIENKLPNFIRKGFISRRQAGEAVYKEKLASIHLKRIILR